MRGLRGEAGLIRRPAFEGRVLLGAGLLSAAFVFWAGLESPVVLFDDAFMFGRYAHNLLEHGLYAWNVEDGPTFGCTSILYTLVVAVAHVLFPGVPWKLLLPGVSLLFAVLAGVAIAGLPIAAAARSAEPTPRPPGGAGGGAPPPKNAPSGRSGGTGLRGMDLRPRALLGIGLLVSIVLLSEEAYTYHARTGMDTTLSLFLHAALVLRVLWGIRSPRGAAGAAVLAYLGFLARPDAALAAFLAPVLYLLASRSELRVVRAFVVSVAGLLAVDTLAKVAVFGNPLPLPFFVKQGFTHGYLGLFRWNEAAYLLGFLHMSLFPFVILILWAGQRSAPAIGALLLPVALSLLYYSTVTQVMGYWFRFYFPLIPYLAGAAAVVGEDLFRAEGRPAVRLARTSIGRLLACAAVAAALLLLRRPAAIAWQAAREAEVRDLGDPHAGRTLPLLHEWVTLPLMLRCLGNLPRDIRFASTEHGVIAATYPEMPIIDLAGLHDPRVARRGVDPAYLLSRKPTLIWFPHRDYVLLHRKLFEDPEIRRRFVLIPEVYDFGMAVARDRPDVLAALVKELRRVYPGPELETVLKGPQAPR